jgi:hypothetical protein
VEEARIVEAASHAARHGGEPAAVLAARTTRGEERFACAFIRGDAFGWLILDGAGRPLTERHEIREVAETIAMCETAEEASARLAAPEADVALARAEGLAADDETAALAIRAMREAIAPLVGGDGAVRVAEGSYLDGVAAAAALVGDRFDFLKETAYGVSARLAGTSGEDGEAFAEAIWSAIRLLARDGAPDRFRESFEGGMAAAGAFADDVIDRYLIDLEEAE